MFLKISLLMVLIVLMVVLIRDKENKVVFEILDLLRLLLNNTFELLKLFVTRIKSFELKEHFTLIFK